MVTSIHETTIIILTRKTKDSAGPTEADPITIEGDIEEINDGTIIRTNTSRTMKTSSKMQVVTSPKQKGESFHKR